MSDYYFTLSSYPTIWFAHRYQTDHYDYSFTSQHNALEVTYIIEGAVHWQQQGRPAAVLEPETILISPREIPFSVSCPQGRHIHETVGMFLPLSLESRERPDALRIPPSLPPSPDNAPVIRLIRRIIQAHALRGSYWSLECGGLALELMAALARASGESREQESLSPGYERYARQALHYIAQHLDERITVADLAGQLKISPGHLSHVFKQATGQTLITAINRMKLNRMQELMITRSLPLRQAAASVGWDDESYASRLFKQHYGLSPTQYLHTYTLDMP